MTYRNPKPADFVGKTITSFDGSCINRWALSFSDGTKLAIEVEYFGNNLYGMVLCDECADDVNEGAYPLDADAPRRREVYRAEDMPDDLVEALDRSIADTEAKIKAEEVKSALDDHLKAEECDIVIPLSEQEYKTPEDMQDYWQKAIGDVYKPVKYGKHEASHPKTVADVLAKLKVGELCPEAADVIVALIHEQSVAWNIADALSKQKIIIDELTKLAKVTRQEPT